ncbi:MAG: hypothetical protein IPK52_13635, partial [Chloroflexi bacterium]|nr:hypothetical protein [Chloroflexota bacterium]
ATAPEEVTHWLLLGLEVRQSIDRLPELQRQTLILFCEEAMSHAEIAEVMDVSIGTVKSRLFHAKKGLRGLVRPELLLAIQAESKPKPEIREIEAEMALGRIEIWNRQNCKNSPSCCRPCARCSASTERAPWRSRKHSGSAR